MIIEIYELWFLLSCNRLLGLLWGIKVSTQREKKWKPWKSCEIEYKACFLTTAGDFHTRCLTFHLKRIRYNCFKFYIDHCYEGKNTTCHLLEQFSIECSNTKTKVITLANHKGHKQYSEPIRTRSNCMWLTSKARENLCERVTIWVWFYFWLDEKVARFFY